LSWKSSENGAEGLLLKEEVSTVTWKVAAWPADAMSIVLAAASRLDVSLNGDLIFIDLFPFS
jgi:hypothetical protein